MPLRNVPGASVLVKVQQLSYFITGAWGVVVGGVVAAETHRMFYGDPPDTGDVVTVVALRAGIVNM